MPGDLNIEFIRWSLDARHAIQAALLNLAQCGQSGKIHGADYPLRFGELSAIGFSLWRAAFLASLESHPRAGPKEAKPQSEHALEFLKTVLTTNAVSFATDMNTSSWMGKYYIDNASFRLQKYIQQHGPEALQPTTQRFLNYWREDQVPADYAASAFAWMIIWNPFVEMLRRLMIEMSEAIVAEMPVLDTASYKFVARPADLGEILMNATAE